MEEKVIEEGYYKIRRKKGSHVNKNDKFRHFSVHNLRYAFCTRVCENETNIKIIQEIMEHSDFSTTMNAYAETTQKNMRVLRICKKR